MPLSKGLDQLVVRSAMLSKKEFFNCESSRRVLSLDCNSSDPVHLKPSLIRERLVVMCLNRLFFA